MLAETISSLYQTALDAEFSYDALEAALATLAKAPVRDLRAAAAAAEYQGVARLSRPSIIASIRQRVQERRHFHARTRINANESL